MELQAKWISLVLSGQLFLPSKETMMADTEDYYRSLEQQGIPLRGTHSLFRTKVFLLQPSSVSNRVTLIC